MSASAPGSRDDTIDILRGFAIAMMVFGHLAIEVLVPPGAFYIEALGGSAPTVFLIVSGMMVAYGVRIRERSFRHFLLRGVQVMAVGAGLDLAVWRIFPFMTVDILYLIGLAVPACALVARRLPPAGALLLATVFILVAPPLQGILGYTDWPTEIPLAGAAPEVIRLEGVGPVRLENPTSVLHHWLIDGWFPVFPWLGTALLGVALSRLRWPAPGALRRFDRFTGLLPAAVLLAASFALGWWNVDYELTLRRRWGGSFMPPGWDYMFGSAGVFFLFAWLVDQAPRARLWAPLRILGTQALLVYFAHFVILRVVGRALPHRVEHPPFWALYLAVLAVLWALVLGWRRLRAARARS